MEIWSRLGDSIEGAWRKANYDEREFPAIAAEALRRAAAHRAVGHADVLRWLLTAPDLPPQDDLGASFGDPPITVYRGRRFYLQVILWLEGSTSIHRHGFSGAFMVLDGTSLHAKHAFTTQRRVSSRLLLGELSLLEAELLDRGDVVEITNDLTHALFHLDPPAATIVARTYHEDEAGPQYSYLPPGLAIDPFYTDATAIRQLQALGFARRTAGEAYLDLATGLIERSDLHLTFLVLQQAHRGREDGAPAPVSARAAPLVEAARRRHGAAVDPLLAAIHEELRVRKLQRLRAAVADPDQRFFLALLQNLPHQDAIFDLLRRRYPGADPRERVATWLMALSGVDRIGLDLNDALTKHVVLAHLEGCSPGGLLTALEEVFEPGEVRAQAAAIARHAQRARRTALAPLLRNRHEGGAAAPAALV